MNVKKLVGRIVKLTIVEVLYGLLISFINIVKSMIEIAVSQTASNAEIARLKGEMPLVVTETISKYNNSLHLIANGFIFILVVLMIYECYKFYENVKKDSAES